MEASCSTIVETHPANGGRINVNSPDVPARPNYWLGSHVYICRLQDGVVILDLRNDKYLSLTLDQMRVITAVLENSGPENLINSGPPIEAEEDRKLVESLLSRGILTTDRSQGKTNTAITLTAVSSLIELGDDIEQTGHVRVADILHFATSCIYAAWALRYRRIEAVVQRVIDRKKAAQAGAVPFDVRRVAELVAVFRKLRSTAVTMHDNCLFHALALVTFLSRYNVFPMWVIGVSTGPFAAHSWVQYEHYVLDGSPEEACFYTPILAV